MATLKVGDKVKKTKGDYRYYGEVVAVIQKRSGVERFIVESDDGLLLIFNEQQLEFVGR